MGHVTVVAGSMREAENYIAPLIAAVDAVKAERTDRDGASATDSLSPSTAHASTMTRSKVPPVAVTMGSDSDLPILKPGISLLSELDIPFEVTITSAHRTPGRMFQFAREAASKGTRVIIAAAGGAAHLPGMIASSTPLPVIGVPVKGSTLDGMDSLLSIVQMPVRQPSNLGRFLGDCERLTTCSAGCRWQRSVLITPSMPHYWQHVYWDARILGCEGDSSDMLPTWRKASWARSSSWTWRAGRYMEARDEIINLFDSNVNRKSLSRTCAIFLQSWPPHPERESFGAKVFFVDQAKQSFDYPMGYGLGE